MSTFKVGDRVVVKRGRGTCLLQELQEYTVQRLTDEGDIIVTVISSRGHEHTLNYGTERFVLIERPGVVVPTVASDLKITPQARRVLTYLKKNAKGISPAEALVSMGISRLASCVHEIRRKAGYDVSCEVKRDDSGHKYARYKLASVH